MKNRQKGVILMTVMIIAIFAAAVSPLATAAAGREEVVYDRDNGTVTYVNKNGERNRYETESLETGTTIVKFFG